MVKKKNTPSAFGEAKGRDVTSGKSLTLTKNKPVQLSLFQTFYPQDETHNYSNTVELYDAIPKYFASPKQMAEMREQGKFLPTLKRAFKHRGKDYTVKITPARIEDTDGVEREYYPTQREELVEEALKKLATDPINGFFLNDHAGLQFTQYELDQELKRRGHRMRWPSLKAALHVAGRAGYEVYGPDGLEMNSPIFPTLLLRERKEWLAEPKNAHCYVQFNLLMTQSINKLTFRQFDYDSFMKLKRQLARWIFKRLSHNYTQASQQKPFKIRHSTLVRDSALVNAKRMRDQVRFVIECLEELKGETKERSPVLTLFQAEEHREGGRKSLVDVSYTLIPHPAFIEQVVHANQRQLKIAKNALHRGVLDQRGYAEQEELFGLPKYG